MSIRVRFAPSPTGYLHLGGARTALFNWLYARHTDGKFLLRVEDTDRERSTEASRHAILEGMEWLGMGWDEDMVLQSDRLDIHLKFVQELLDAGKAYKCFATAEDMATMRTEAFANGRTRIYDRTWRDRTDHPVDAPYTIRMKMPIEGNTTINDLVLGEITVQNDDLDDLIILRSDGSPTYNFVVVCDDHFMKVNHVVRGQDHMTNTFRQYNIYKALGYEPPAFAHLPLIDGLSKSKGSPSVQRYRDEGFLSEAVVNYIARLGWSHGDQEVFTVDELIAKFDLAGVNKSSGNFDIAKMTWVNVQWMKRLPAPTIAERLLPFLAKVGVETQVDDRLILLVENLVERNATLVDMAAAARFAYVAPTEYQAKAVKKWIKANSKPAFASLIDAIEALEVYNTETIEAAFTKVIADHEIKMGKVAQPVRIALTGTSMSPGIYETIAVVEQADAVARMRRTLELFPEPQG